MESPSSSQEGSECQVCRISRFDSNVFSKITCTVCKRQTHKFCYAPDLRDNANFKCDQCRKNRSGMCVCCGKRNGILKDIGEKMWAHVICALFSPKIKLQNYKSLQFKLVNFSGEKQEMRIHMCEVCKQQMGQTFHCWIEKDKCRNYIHVGCIVGYKFEPGKQCYLTYNLLDKQNNAVMSHLISQYEDKFESFRYMKPKKIRPVVCQEHNDDPNFIFCTCNRSRFENNRKQRVNVQQVQCDSCKRWYHSVCVMVTNLNQEFICSGCKQNNFFKKAVQLPELIEKMGEIEAAGKIDKEVIKILDSCILKLSILLIDLCLQKRSIDEINRYYCRRVLDRLYKDDRHYPDRSFFVIKEQKILQLLWLLTKRENDQIETKMGNGQISRKEILNVMNADRNCLGLHTDCFRRYQKFLEDKLVIVQKIDKETGMNIHMQLAKYATERDTRSESVEQIAKQTFAMIEKMQKSKQFSINVKYMTKRDKSFLEILYKSRLTVEQFQLIFKRYRRIAILKRQSVVNQSQFCELLTWSQKQFEGLNLQKKRQIAEYFRTLMKNFTIIAEHEEHQTALSSALNKISANVRPQQLCCIRKELVNQLMYLAADSPLCVADYTQTFYRIKKLKVLGMVTNPINEQLQRVVQQIRTYLSSPEHCLDLTSQEKKTIDSFFNRSRFYLQMVNFQSKTMGERAFMKSELDETEISFDKACTLGGMEGLQDLAFEAMSKWDDSAVSVNFGFNLLADLIAKGTELSPIEQETISKFASKLLKSLYMRFQKNVGAMNSTVLRKASWMIKFFRLDSSFPQFLQWWVKYSSWKQKLQQFNDLDEVLFNVQKFPRLTRLASQSLTTAQIMRLDLTSEMRKLKVLRLWIQFSNKFFDINEQGKKRTPYFVEQMMQMMEKSRYPANRIKDAVAKLQIEKKMLMEKVRLFQPMKLGPNDQIYDELAFINRKPRVTQAQQAIAVLQASSMDMFFEINKIQEHIEQYLLIPSDLQGWTNQQQNSLSIENMRKAIIECPLRFEPLKDYVYMYHRMYELKCNQAKNNTSFSTSRKQFTRMLNHGGEGAVFLLQKMTNLLNSYRMIESAKNEVMQEKPRSEILLPADPRKLRNDLREDQFQSRVVDVYYHNMNRLRQKFKQMRKSKLEWQAYVELLSEIHRQPVNASDLIESINEMKRVVDECVRGVVMVEHNRNYEYDVCSELIAKYKANGVRHHKMQRFQTVYNRYRTIMDLNSQINVNTYQQFSKLCEEYNEIATIKPVEQLRDKHFSSIFVNYTQSSQKMAEIGHALITEGRYLLKKTNRGRDVVPKLHIIARKLFPDQVMAASSSSSSMTSSAILTRKEDSINSPRLRKSASQQNRDMMDVRCRTPPKYQNE